jgi:hypothetical protein
MEENGLDPSDVDSMYTDLQDRLEAVDAAAQVVTGIAAHGKHGKVGTGRAWDRKALGTTPPSYLHA